MHANAEAMRSRSGLRLLARTTCAWIALQWRDDEVERLSVLSRKGTLAMARSAIPFVIAAMFCTTAMAGGELPGYYKNPGLDARHATANHSSDEHIDPFSGMLQLHHVDMTVPGNGGFDLILQRSYNNPGPAFGSISDTMSYNRTPNLGVGWNLLLGGRVLGATGAGGACTGGNQLSFETPDGHRHGFLRQGDGTFLSPKRWKAECVAGGVKIYTTDSTRYDMLQGITENIPGTIQTAPFLYPTRIEDRNANSMTFTYGTLGTTTVLNEVNTSDARRVVFSYGTFPPSTTVVLSMVTIGSRNWTYYYYPTPAINDPVSGKGVAFQLSAVDPPAGGHWTYTYNTCLIAAAGACALAGFTYPEGGGNSYTYGYVNFNDGAGNTAVVTGKSAGGVMMLAGYGNNWTYAYTPGSIGVDDTTVVTTPMGTTTYRHVGASTVGSGNTWKIGLLTERRQTSSGGGTLETETFTWDKQQISTYPTLRTFGQNDGVTFAPLLVSRSINRDGATFTVTNSNFDAFGNPANIEERGERTKTTARTYFSNVVAPKYLVGLPLVDDMGAIGRITRGYDASGNLLSETRFGVNTSYSYYGDGGLATRTDANGNITEFQGYVRGTAQTEKRPMAVTITRTVDPDGNVTSQSDGAGNVYAYQYDSLRRMTRITPPVGAPTVIAWNGFASRQLTRGAYLETTSFDGVGNPYLVTRAGIKTLIAYDPFLRKIYESLPGEVDDSGGTIQAIGTTTPRDFLGRVTEVKNPDTTKRTLSHSGNTTTERDERGWQTQYRYWSYADPRQRLLFEAAHVSLGSTAMDRDGLGNITSVTQGSPEKGTVTRTYGYNGSYQLTSANDPETGTSTFGRDNNGNMTSRSVGGRSTTFVYDGLNRLTKVNYPTGSVDITYLGNGRTSSVTSPDAVRTYGYDGNANLTSETLNVGGQSFTIGYTYDANDALATITYPRTNETISYAPNALGRPTKALPYITGVTYFDSGNPEKISYASGIDQSWQENSRQWPFEIKAQKANDTNAAYLMYKQFAYDPAGNLKTYWDAIKPANSLNLLYDGMNQLYSAQGSKYAYTYEYDHVGNRTRTTLLEWINGPFGQGWGSHPSVNYVYANNRLQSVDSSTYAYDGYGNVTSVGYGPYARAYQYNDASNMTCADCGTANEIRYYYDGNNRRVKRVKGTETTYYVQAANGDLLLEFTTPSNVAIQHVYLNGKRIASKRVQL